MNRVDFIGMCRQLLDVKSTSELLNPRAKEFARISKNTIFEVSQIISLYKFKLARFSLREISDITFKRLIDEMFTAYTDRMAIISINYTIKEKIIFKLPVYEYTMSMEVKYEN
jgi:hypothetical protein